jgi:type II secretory pathway component PulK
MSQNLKPERRGREAQAATDQGGAVLLMVILVLALISVLILSWGQEWRTELRLAANFREAHQCRRLAEAGVYYALGKVMSAKIEEISQRNLGTAQDVPTPPPEWQGDQKPHLVEFPGGWAEIRVADEGGKIDLNQAPEDILTNLFRALKVPPATVRIMVDSIQDWRSRGTIPRPYGAKSDYYLHLEPPYVVKNSNFETVEELAWVRGFENSPLSPRLGDWLTVQPTAMKVNINTALLPVLQALGLDSEICQTIIATRQTRLFSSLVGISQLSQDPRLVLDQTLTFQSSPFFTIKSTGMVSKDKGLHTIKAVGRLDYASPSPWTIISWIDNFPG